MWISQTTDFSAFELDELYWFTNHKYPLAERENIYTITMTSRIPRQIVGFDVDYDKEAERIQRIIDSVDSAENYYTDGNPTYLDVIFSGRYNRNTIKYQVPVLHRTNEPNKHLHKYRDVPFSILDFL